MALSCGSFITTFYDFLNAFINAVFVSSSASNEDITKNAKVLKQADIASIEPMLLKSQLNLADHEFQIEDFQIARIVLFGEPSVNYWDGRPPKKTYKNSLKKQIGACHIGHQMWSTIAVNYKATH